MTGINDILAQRVISDVMREDYGRLFAALMRSLRDFHLCEDCLQDALASAVVHWGRSGAPPSPQGWLLQTARRKAIDRLRRSRNFAAKADEYGALLELDQLASENTETPEIEDDRLRLIFTCCHPALEEKTRVALTLRTLCGLSTKEIARAFLDREEAMAQRLVRAQQKISQAGIPYEVPDAAHMSDRLISVRAVIYLVFNEGYAATAGSRALRVDLCEEAIRLGRLMVQLMPGSAETEGLLALMLLTHSRRLARVTPEGEIVPLEFQNRGLWDVAMIAEGTALLGEALNRRNAGPYQLQAAVSAVHSEENSYDETRWHEIVLLYDGLHALSANPVYLLNRAVALSYEYGPDKALAALEPIETLLGTYQPFHAAKADFLRRAGRVDLAQEAYEVAIKLSQNESERAFLAGRRKEMVTLSPTPPTTMRRPRPPDR
jgi:RNA polymerase sigma-70 factor, ECF subfamily